MRLHDAFSQIRSAMLRSSMLFALLVPLACAVAIEPDPAGDEEGGSGGVAGSNAGAPPSISGAGMTTPHAFGGTGSMPMTGGAAGMPGSAGRGGMVSSGGKPSGGAGQGGMSSAGTNHGGSGGASGGSGGAVSNGCSALKAWKGGDSTLTIAAGEVVSWKGKRYKATASIAYPNTECAPDAPAMWCANWFTADGDC
jgi:hypothetical protein